MTDKAKIIAGNDSELVVARTNEKGTSLDVYSRLKEGQSLPQDTEVIVLSRESKESDIFDVHVISKGPARVATPQYRENYDAIFGKPNTKREVFN